MEDSWNYEPPTTCNLNLQKFFEIKKPYKGPYTFGAILKMPTSPNHKKFKGQADTTKISLPDNFSWREKGQDQIEKPRNQESCGGCWAFSTVSVLGDRFALANQLQSPLPSAAWLISENYNIPQINQDGCSGGITFNAAKWLESNSNLLESCWPFRIITNANHINPRTKELLGPNPLDSRDLNGCCFNCCGDKIKNVSDVKISCNPGPDSNNPYTKYFGVNVDQLQNGNYTTEQVERLIDEIKTDIMYYGPVTASFYVTKDFMEYWSKIKRNPSLTDFSKNDPDVPVYKPNPLNPDDRMGGHAVVITGWGIAKDGTKYWEVRNSWGENTGDGGYCKFAISTISPGTQRNLYDDQIIAGSPSWRGLDIPIILNNNYFGGIVSFVPNDISNLQELIDKGIFKKSVAGNLLPNGSKPAPPAPSRHQPASLDKPPESSHTLLYIIIAVVSILLILLLLYFNIKH
jgi:hypothetical protein